MKKQVDSALEILDQIKAETPGQYTVGGVAGQWGEWAAPPEWPVPTALPAANPVIDLHAPAPVPVLLRSQVPSVVRLRGRPEVVFSRALVALTAKPLQRNLADGRWGAAISDVSAGDSGYAGALEYLLPGAQRVSVFAAKRLDVQFQVRTGGQWQTVLPAPKFILGVNMSQTVYEVSAETDAVQVLYDVKPASVVLLSESAPMRVMLAAGDDTPLQSFPSSMPAGESVLSRDLAGDLNRAWAGAKAVGNGLVEVPLKITSLTDGLVEVKLEGGWQRQLAQPPLEIQVNPFEPASVTVPWLPGANAGSIAMQVAGAFATGRRVGIAEQVGAGRPFAVRVTENLAIAQAALLRSGGGTGPARAVTAVWLALPAVPPEPQTLELKLTTLAGDPAAPAEGAPLAQAVATLPADTAAYISPTPGGPVWHRVAFDRPVDLDGTASGQPVCLVCAGREGTRLVHRSAGAVERQPALAGPGTALVRNLAWASDWEDQRFDRTPARWVFDLELAPLPDEAALSLNNQPIALVDGKAVYSANVAVQNGAPVPASISVPVLARAGGTLTLTVLAAAPA